MGTGPACPYNARPVPSPRQRMDIIVNQELKAYIDPLTPDEHESLERSLLTEGCRDALVLWGDLLIDGHNRYGICSKHGIPFKTVQNTQFKSIEDVHLWMIEQHLGRRSLSDFQRGELALRKREIIAKRQREAREAEEAALAASQAEAQARAEVQAEAVAAGAQLAGDDDLPPWDEPAPINRAEIAREARLSSNQVAMIERIHNQAAPEVIEAVRSGDISISAAAAVASLPEEEQRAAAQGGRSELKQAAKRVRDSKKKPKSETESTEDKPDVKALQRRISELEQENERLHSQLSTLQEQLQRLRG